MILGGKLGELQVWLYVSVPATLALKILVGKPQAIYKGK
jgi:hypothetical protein